MAVEINTFQEQHLLAHGLDSFSLEDKNNLITILAGRVGLPYSAISDEYIMRHHKNLKIDILSDRCQEEILKGFKASNGHTYRTNRDDQVNLLGQKYSIKPTDTHVAWKTEDVGYYMHTVEEWVQVFIEALEHKKMQLFYYDTLKRQILAAKNDAEVVAIEWKEQVLNPETPPTEPTPEPTPEEPPVIIPEDPAVEPQPPVEEPIEEPVVEPAEPVEEPEIDPLAPVVEPTEPPTEEPIEPFGAKSVTATTEEPKGTVFQIFNRGKK